MDSETKLAETTKTAEEELVELLGVDLTEKPTAIEPNPEESTSSETEEAEFEQRYLEDAWYTRYKNGSFMRCNTAGEWVPVAEDQLELVQQLWFEAIAAETKVIDGVTYKWDAEGQEWQRVETSADEAFIAAYQSQYGVQYDYSQIPTPEPSNPTKKKPPNDDGDKAEQKRRKNKLPPQGWLDMEEKSTAVYVSNLPPDIDEEDFHDFMAKCGVIQIDPRNNKPKVRLYRTSTGELKGDGRCTYIKAESVELALSILDGSMFNNSRITVEPARFEMKGEYDPAKKKRRLTAAQKKRFFDHQNKIFAWLPDRDRAYRPKSDCVVILKNVFTIEELEENAALLFDIKEEMNKLGSKYGNVKKVVLYDNNPDGVIGLYYTNTDESDLAVKMLNNKLIRNRVITANHWDGRTKYKIEETEEDRSRRLEAFGRALGGDSSSDDDATPQASDNEESSENIEDQDAAE